MNISNSSKFLDCIAQQQSGTGDALMKSLATGMAAGAGFALVSGMREKRLRKLIRQEVRKAQASRTGPGLNGISFFS